MKKLFKFLEKLSVVESEKKKGAEYKKMIQKCLDCKHLMNVCSSAVEEHEILQMALNNIEEFLTDLIKTGNIQTSNDSIKPFLKHTLNQFASHLHSGNEDAIVMALASMEVLSDEDFLNPICNVLDSNSIVKESVKFIINNNVSWFNSNRLMVIPYKM